MSMMTYYDIIGLILIYLRSSKKELHGNDYLPSTERRLINYVF